MIFVKMTLYGYAVMTIYVLIVWLFGNKLDLGEEEIQEDEINKDGSWN